MTEDMIERADGRPTTRAVNRAIVLAWRLGLPGFRLVGAKGRTLVQDFAGETHDELTESFPAVRKRLRAMSNARLFSRWFKNIQIHLYGDEFMVVPAQIDQNTIDCTFYVQRKMTPNKNLEPISGSQ